MCFCTPTQFLIFKLIRAEVVAKDTDYNNLRKPLDGKPLGALCTSVTSLTHLEDAEINIKKNVNNNNNDQICCFQVNLVV